MGDFSTSALANRTMSAFPISIGSSLALESIFRPMQAPYDPDRPIPQKVHIGDYDVFWVCLMTLYRNVIGALEKDGELRVMPADISDALAFEVDLIRRLVAEESLGTCRLGLYASNYKDLAKHHPHAKLRVHGTEKQQRYHAMMEITLSDFFKNQVKTDDLQLVDRLLQPLKKERALIMTHYAYDLLAVKNFDKLDLLESHTGLCKGQSLWYTKLYNGKDLVNLPFNSAILQIFGDSQTFSPLQQSVRHQVLELAHQFKWHSSLTPDRFRFCVGQMKDVFTRQVILKMNSEA